MKVNKVTNAHCLRGVAAQPASSSGEEGEEEKNMTPATHTLPPSLNYHRRVAHTAGDDEEKNALRGREGSGRERREWRIIALELRARVCECVFASHTQGSWSAVVGFKGPLCTIRAQPRPPERVRPSCCNTPHQPLHRCPSAASLPCTSIILRSHPTSLLQLPPSATCGGGGGFSDMRGALCGS